ncbi:MAG: transglutaminase domain-containing protein [Candidatus Methanofastidiosa archaeon]|jgi:transglutaminase-like putative cysteine protease|nr:transglutaminase domain-containing protein [Candidatus Methanofastidiosa archaeon]
MKNKLFFFFILFLFVLVSLLCLNSDSTETNITIVDKNKNSYNLEVSLQYEIKVNNREILEPSLEVRLLENNEHQKITDYFWEVLINESNYSSANYSTFYYYESKTGKWDFKSINRDSNVSLKLKYNLETNNTYQNPLNDSINIDNRIYILPSGGIESDNPKIIELSQKITEGNSNDVEKIQRLYEYVSKLEYQEDKDGRGSALKCLERGGGDCDNKAFLLCALLRAQNIPARPVFGFIYGEKIAHTWVEVYVGQWLNVDPTNKNFFYLPARYVKLTSGNGYYDLVTVYYKTNSTYENEIKIKDIKFEIVEINN